MRALRALRSSYVTGERRQLLLELAAEDRVRAERTQPLAVQRCVQTVRANARRRVQRARAMTGAASRVAVCIGRWNAMRSADTSISSRRRSFAASTHVTVHPAACS